MRFQVSLRSIFAIITIIACYLGGVRFVWAGGGYSPSLIAESSIHAWTLNAPEILACSVAFAVLFRYRKNPSRLWKYTTIVLFTQLMFFLFRPLFGYVVLTLDKTWECYSCAFRSASVVDSFIRASIIFFLMLAVHMRRKSELKNN